MDTDGVGSFEMDVFSPCKQVGRLTRGTLCA